jgi:hypothetical protein
MPTEVLATPRADQQLGSLNRKQARTVDAFLNDLAARGCHALAYRLAGEAPINHLCVKHLRGELRVVVAFETPSRAWILLAGPHNDRDPVLNVYAELYRLLGTQPQLDSARDKPPCCNQDAGEPPILGEALAAILDRATKLRKTRQAMMMRPLENNS